MKPKANIWWLLCLIAAACAIQGLRSAKTVSALADEFYEEWLERKG